MGVKNVWMHRHVTPSYPQRPEKQNAILYPLVSCGGQALDFCHTRHFNRGSDVDFGAVGKKTGKATRIWRYFQKRHLRPAQCGVVQNTTTGKSKCQNPPVSPSLLSCCSPSLAAPLHRRRWHPTILPRRPENALMRRPSLRPVAAAECGAGWHSANPQPATHILRRASGLPPLPSLTQVPSAWRSNMA